MASRRLRLLRLAFLASAAAVLALALMPHPQDLPSTGWDKANHALAFAWLAVLGALAWPGRAPALLAGLLAFGAGIEALQAVMPDRTADAADLLADAAGLLAGWLATHTSLRLRSALGRRPGPG